MRGLEATLNGVDPEEMKKVNEQIEREQARMAEEQGVPQEKTDLAKTGEIAEKFMRGLHNVEGVLMLLAYKFGRAAYLLIPVMIVLLINTGFQILGTWQDIQREKVLQGLVEKQNEILKAAEKAEKRAEKAEGRTAAAEARLNEVAKSVPKVVVDEKGESKLVAPVDDQTAKSIEEAQKRKPKHLQRPAPKLKKARGKNSVEFKF